MRTRSCFLSARSTPTCVHFGLNLLIFLSFQKVQLASCLLVKKEREQTCLKVEAKLSGWVFKRESGPEGAFLTARESEAAPVLS